MTSSCIPWITNIRAFELIMFSSLGKCSLKRSMKLLDRKGEVFYRIIFLMLKKGEISIKVGDWEWAARWQAGPVPMDRPIITMLDSSKWRTWRRYKKRV